MILQVDHLSKSFGDRVILSEASFRINDNEKFALIGANGIGKTTLLKMIAGEELPDSGRVILASDTTIGYLPQQLGYHSDLSIYEELFAVRSDLTEQEKRLRELEVEISEADDVSREALLKKYDALNYDFEQKDGYTYKSRVLGVVNGLGFAGDAMHTCINNLSGGQKTRVALGKLLLQEPDLLILDEPTNHLDMTSVSWLENYISSYSGSVLIVSHDRYFLDKWATHIVELDNRDLITYKGDYSSYAKTKELRRKTLINDYKKQQQVIKHEEEVIKKLRQFNREKSIRRADSRQKMLDKIDRIEKPIDTDNSMHFSLEPAVISGKDVLDTDNLSKAFDDNLLFSDVNISVKRGEKVAIIGDNGTGKTTLLRMIAGTESITSGTITLGTNVEIGYYDQEHGILHDEKTMFEEIQDDYPYLTNTEIRNTLAAFLFTEDDVFKTIGSLSGGEKGRVSLAKLMLSEANLLLLDEPTNHLDIQSREILESAIKDYAGTVICVSHDRYFIKNTAQRILDLTDKRFIDFIGGYEYYLEKKDELKSRLSGGAASDSSSDSPSDNPTKSKASETKLDWQEQKKIEASRRKLQKEFDETEAKIDRLENEISEIDALLCTPEIGTNLAKLRELTDSRDSKSDELASLMDKWEALSIQLEEV